MGKNRKWDEVKRLEVVKRFYAKCLVLRGAKEELGYCHFTFKWLEFTIDSVNGKVFKQSENDRQKIYVDFKLSMTQGEAIKMMGRIINEIECEAGEEKIELFWSKVTP